MTRTTNTGPVRQHVWAGARGFDQVNRQHQFSAPDPDCFALARRSTTIDQVRITRWHLSSLSGRRDPCREPGIATILAVIDGSVEYRADGAEGHAGIGTVLALREGRPMWFRTDLGADVIEIQVPRPHAVRCGDDRPTDAITSIPVTSSEAALLALARYTLDPGRPRSTAVTRAIAPLSAAVLDEHLPQAGPRSLRDEILEHIEEHLYDADLGPESIAEAFGISLRWVHQVFTVDAETISRYIRHRRIRFVQERLRSSAEPPRLIALAMDSGFKSRDNLTKVFKAETGMTVREYIAAHGGDR